MMMEPQVMKMQMLIKVMKRTVFLTAYREEAAFCIQPKRFRIEYDVETKHRPELLPTHKLNAKALNTRMITKEIMQTVLRYTNRKCREVRRTLSTPQNYHDFSMEKFKFALAVILRAGNDRDNFTKLQNLWHVGDSNLFTGQLCL